MLLVGRQEGQNGGLLVWLSVWGPIYKISYNLSYDYRKFVVRSTYDSDLKSTKINFFYEYRRLICEHCLRQSYDFASESYLRKASGPS